MSDTEIGGFISAVNDQHQFGTCTESTAIPQEFEGIQKPTMWVASGMSGQQESVGIPV